MAAIVAALLTSFLASKNNIMNNSILRAIIPKLKPPGADGLGRLARLNVPAPKTVPIFLFISCTLYPGLQVVIPHPAFAKPSPGHITHPSIMHMPLYNNVCIWEDHRFSIEINHISRDRTAAARAMAIIKRNGVKTPFACFELELDIPTIPAIKDGAVGFSGKSLTEALSQ